METKKVEQTLSECIQSYNRLRLQRIFVPSGADDIEMDPSTTQPCLYPLDHFARIEGVDHTIPPLDQHLEVLTTATDILKQFDELILLVSTLKEWDERTRQRLEEKDPITNAPRYGPKTAEKMRQLLICHQALQQAIQYSMETDSSFYSHLKRSAFREENELRMKQASSSEQNTQLETKNLQLATDHQTSEVEEKEKAALYLRQKEHENISRLAEMSRSSRLDNQRRQEEEERNYEFQLEASVSKGVHGARKELDRLREHCKGNEFTVAVRALHILFHQIVKNPENIAHRRIRRENKSFISDIGRHPGGIELLIAAGYRFEIIESEKCLYLREPDIEHEMDSWTKWFDTLKDISALLSDESLR